MIIALVFVLFLGTQTSSNYTSSSSSTGTIVIDTGDAYKNSIIKDKTSPVVKLALKNLPPEKLEKLKKADTEEFKNTINEMMYQKHMPKPLYSITSSSSSMKK
jgi:hypothetical protein